jgi:hypothetical protein
VPRFVAAVALVLLAGCGAALDCPAEYGEGFQQEYEKVIAGMKAQGVAIPPDSDGDCIADIVEVHFGTDPEDYASRPSLEALASAA